jgi:hypothetical protein
MLENTETLISHTRVLDELEEKARDSKLNALEKKVGGNKSFLSTGNLSRAKKEKEIEKKFLSIADLDEVSGNSRSVKNYDFYDGESIFKKEGEDRRSKLIGNNNDEEKSVEKSREELRVMAQVIREGKKSEEYKTIPGLDKKMIGSVVSAFAVGKALRDKDPNWRQNKGILNLDEVPSEYNLSLAQIKPKDNGPEISIADIDSQKSLPDNNKNVGKSMDGVKA